jgi:hypothetical protein
LQRGLLVTTTALTLLWIVLSPAPKAFGVTPAPDGGYPNDNTAEGSGALFSLARGFGNTATDCNFGRDDGPQIGVPA